MISRAYHDSLFMARIAPTGMIFIPCREGISHRPDEYSSTRRRSPEGSRCWRSHLKHCRSNEQLICSGNDHPR